MKGENTRRKFAVVTGASTGIGYELAVCCARDGHDLLIVADEPEIFNAGDRLRTIGATVQAINADLATTQGVDELYGAADPELWSMTGISIATKNGAPIGADLMPKVMLAQCPAGPV